jgi:hypothetical protein
MTSAEPMFAPRSGAAEPMFAPRSGAAEPMFAPRSGAAQVLSDVAPQSDSRAP